MCTVTVILPRTYPQYELSECIRPLAEPSLPRQTDCFLGNEKLVWHNNGFYYLFSCQPRQLTLSAVSDYNPLIGLRPQPLDRALSEVAMEDVERLVVRHRKYEVKASTGNRLRKELRRNLNSLFFCNRYAVKNYFGPLPQRMVDEHYLELISLAEEAIINPARLFLLAPETEKGFRRSLLLLDRGGAAFKCTMSETRLRITQAAPPKNFSIHSFRNQDIKITIHCLDRFATRVLGRNLLSVNPVVTEGQLLKFIKNKAVSHCFQMGRMAFVNVSGYIFIGALSRGKLNLVTTYQETPVDKGEFHRQVLCLFEQKQQLNN